MTHLTRLHLWPLRALWVALALGVSAGAGDALDGRSTPALMIVAVVGWTLWAGALVALLVPRTSSLTAVRILVPAGGAVGIVTVGAGQDVTALELVTLVVAALAVVVTLAPWTTDAFVDGSSYGSERRLALRTPLALAVVATATWTVMAVASTGAIVVVAAQQWAAGVVAIGATGAIVWFGTRSLHQLSQRWLVLVPTGLVLHDPLVMPEPQLLLRHTISRLGPAEDQIGDDEVAEDLTAGASGLVMSITLTEPVELLVRNGTRGTTLRSVDRVLFSPARPVQLLAEARTRRLPVA